MSYILYLTSYILLIICLFPRLAYADISTNDNWTIEVNDVNITRDIPISDKKKQPANQSYSLQPSIFLSINISNSIIDYGPLSPTNQIYRTSSLNISSNNKKGFIVIAYENHPLNTTESNSFIPDSTCDNGSCSEVTSAIWTNTLTYGFGYRCDNVNYNNCPIDFKQSDYYKQFSDNSKNEAGQIVMSDNLPLSNHEIQITYKVNISKTQPNDNYSNEITYIAIPKY
ncbi:hypothetical protein KKF69_06900 [Patescibacteria group bacterium]|nr:hypothetical protein [Patescibacteria group bacterium]MBU4017170.1 hypothetical protein [Patescibacteria group bacterium]